MDAAKKSNAAIRDQPAACPTNHPRTDRARLLLPTDDGHAAAPCGNAGVPAAGGVLIFLGCIFLFVTVREVRDRPRDLAFLAFAYADLAALFLCLRRAERLPREPSPDGAQERRRLQLGVWVLSGALSCAFAYRVSLIMPGVLVVVVWSMTSLVVIVGLYVLVLCDDQGDAGECKGFAKKIGNNGGESV